MVAGKAFTDRDFLDCTKRSLVNPKRLERGATFHPCRSLAMYLFIVPLFMYTAIHIIATLQKAHTNEADGHLFRAAAGICAMYVIIAVIA